MKNIKRLLYTLAFLKFILPFFLQHAVWEPHRDELLYLQQAHHMAWGFMETPPLLSLFAWLGQLFGSGMFWIKCWPSLFGALTYLVVGQLILSLGGRAFALLLGWLPFIFGGYLRVHFLFQPNFLDIFFWTLMAYSLVRAQQTGQNKWLYLFGVSVGLGMLSKYTTAFFLVSLLAGMALTPQRRWFANKHFYYSLALALLIFLPNLVWQLTHDLPVVYHMRELRKNQLQYVSPSTFLSEQLIDNLPCIFIWLAGLWSVGYSRRMKDYRFMGWAWVTVILLLLAGHGKGYYALGAYPVLFAFGACQLERFVNSRMRGASSSRIGTGAEIGIGRGGGRGRHFSGKAWRLVFVLIPVCLGFWVLPIALPILPPARLAAFYKWRHVARLGVLKWEDGKDHPLPQDFADMLGWKEMAQAAGKAYATLDSNEKEHLLLFCDNYGQAGALNYYGKQYGLPEAYSDNASFLYWMPDTRHIDNILLVTDDRHEMEHPFLKDFASAVLADSVTNPYAVERGDLILVLKHANEKMQQYFRDKIAADKAKITGR
jgi:Dolichyl-phosphate-mannose-protein mannosyltransferase